MKDILATTCLALALSLAACSNGGGGGGAAPAQSPVTPVSKVSAPVGFPYINGKYTYEYSVNNCLTGRHEFSTIKDYCEGLHNEVLNNNCAENLRIADFNRLCADGDKITQPEFQVAGAVSTARCVVNNIDLKDRSFLQTLNPFSLQRHQVIREIFWDGNQEHSYDILGGISTTYGKAKFTMKAEQKKLPAAGVVSLVQGDDENSYLVSSYLGSQISLNVQNASAHQETQVACVSDGLFRKAKADLQQVSCTYKTNEHRRAWKELISWDLDAEFSKIIFEKKAAQNISLHLKPAVDGQDEKIEIEILDLDADKSVKAEGTLNEGLGLSFISSATGTNFTLSCAPASK